MNRVHFSSKTDLHSTPQDFYDRLNEEFGFTLDVCATKENAKCSRYFDLSTDGLKQSWGGERVWCNPPYGREIGKWVDRCSKAGMFDYSPGTHAPTLAVMLLPARTDTRWWHDFVIPRASEVRFIKGRLKFGGAKNSAPFPSAVVVFRGAK